MKSLIAAACVVMLAASTASADPNYIIQAPLTPAPLRVMVPVQRAVVGVAPACTTCPTCPTGACAAPCTTCAPTATTFAPTTTMYAPATTAVVAEPQYVPQVQYVPQATVTPTTAYMPTAAVVPAGTVVGQKVLYVQGQPLRNWWRGLTSGTRTTVAKPVVTTPVVVAPVTPVYVE